MVTPCDSLIKKAVDIFFRQNNPLIGHGTEGFQLGILTHQFLLICCQIFIDSFLPCFHIQYLYYSNTFSGTYTDITVFPSFNSSSHPGQEKEVGRGGGGGWF